MPNKISIADLVQFEDADKIDTTNLEEDINSTYAVTREEVFKLLEQRREKRASRSSSNFYEVASKTELEKSIDRILNKKEDEEVSVARARRSFKYEFDKKMMRIKRIKSKAYRRIRRAAKLKNEHESVGAVDSATQQEEVKEERYSRIPDNLLKEMESHSEEEDTPVLSFGGPEESPRNAQEELVRLAFREDVEENEKEFTKEKEEVVNLEAPKMEEIILPGWGDWAGPGLELIKTKENTTVNFVSGVKYSNRKDFNKSHIVINENTPDVDKKFLTGLPFGYTEEEYSSKIKAPISKEWNTLRIFKKLVKTKPDQINGGVIEPFRYEPED